MVEIKINVNDEQFAMLQKFKGDKTWKDILLGIVEEKNKDKKKNDVRNLDELGRVQAFFQILADMDKVSHFNYTCGQYTEWKKKFAELFGDGFDVGVLDEQVLFPLDNKSVDWQEYAEASFLKEHWRDKEIIALRRGICKTKKSEGHSSPPT
jgi:hypothetical protein